MRSQRNQNGDIVKVFNERGAVLGGAYVTERIMPEWSISTMEPDMIRLFPENWTGEGPSIPLLLITLTSKNATGMVVSGFLVEVEYTNMSDLRKKYPEAFKRPYNSEAGLSFERGLENK